MLTNFGGEGWDVSFWNLKILINRDFGHKQYLDSHNMPNLNFKTDNWRFGFYLHSPRSNYMAKHSPYYLLKINYFMIMIALLQSADCLRWLRHFNVSPAHAVIRRDFRANPRKAR